MRAKAKQPELGVQRRKSGEIGEDRLNISVAARDSETLTSRNASKP
jgi:hypothetical protein